jgi:exosome complex exonuclease RRP6
MQISDREEDWIVDMLALRDEVETIERGVYGPKHSKVSFYSFQIFINKEQQDLRSVHLYIDNLFNVFHASKLLGSLLTLLTLATFYFGLILF